MVVRPVLDLDLLRTLVFIAEEKSFTRAAERVGRTQSAVTLQMQKLEGLVGYPLLARSKGGPVELTPHGQVLVAHASALLKGNDEALAALSPREVPTSLRIGASSYFAPLYLQRTLDAMRAAYPNVLVEVTQGRSCQLVPQLRDDAFDLVISEGGVEPRDSMLTEAWSGPLRWITSASADTHLRDPLPLSLWPSKCPWRPPWMEDCFWRSATMRALYQAGRAFEIVAVSDTMEGHFTAVKTGEAVAISLDMMLPPGVRVVEKEEGLPPLPNTRLVILKGQNATQPLTDILAAMIAANVESV